MREDFQAKRTSKQKGLPRKEDFEMWSSKVGGHSRLKDFQKTYKEGGLPKLEDFQENTRLLREHLWTSRQISTWVPSMETVTCFCPS